MSAHPLPLEGAKLALNHVLVRPAQSIHISFPKVEPGVDKIGPECGTGQERAGSFLVLAIYAELGKLPHPNPFVPSGGARPRKRPQIPTSLRALAQEPPVFRKWLLTQGRPPLAVWTSLPSLEAGSRPKNVLRKVPCSSFLRMPHTVRMCGW